ncbi:hypothetical protein CONLIGDRAFT_244618 [Coniochaeta ligniaria NRRL 30616]|uniref:Apple domain-containing protein n=1 Tax=Coniochaeta ligniaria NRRL 30616 TaxID=1408157 RepID=A0A1J7IVY8_9PEZI|nr:hypothetical protein CONLIGDRAFT_244618 [Coniochaeta ligniaria NRRL 30616]
MARLPLIEGRDNAPCPKANGTTIGTDQQFILLCGSDVVGDVIDRPDAADFQACVDICSSFHPKCEAVSFNKRKCELRANLKADRTHPSKFTDAAVGQFPGASSNCATLGGSQVVQPNGMNFGTFCNFIINGKDMSQNFAPTFQDCMGQCAGTTGCTAVSFDASMSQGFKNCYLKTGASASDNIADQGIDTAVVQNNAAVVAPAPAPAPAPASSAAPAPSPATTTVLQPTTVIPDPVTISAAPVSAAPATTLTPLTQAPAPAPATTGGASFFTPPGAGSATAPAPISVATETVISIITSVSVSDAVSVTQLITVPVTTEITATPAPLGTSAADSAPSPSTSSSADGSTTAQLDQGPDTSSSRAWIAAPVVGSIAALVVVVVVFVMLGRRRMRSSRPGTARTTSSAESGDSGGGLFTTWLPGSPRFRNRIMGASVGSGMGNFSSVTGKTVSQPAPVRTASMRSSVFGILGTKGAGNGAERLEDVEEGSDGFGRAEKKAGGGERDGVTPVYEVRNGRMELRESLNGLSQHRWSER